MSRPFSPAAVILAAGASSRMGRPKMLLPWGATTIIGHLIQQWRRLGAQKVAVVCAGVNAPQPDGPDSLTPSHLELAGELDRLGLPLTERIFNPAPERGMFSSIQCAARWPGWKPELTHWILVLGDQPHLRLVTLKTLLDFAAAHPDRICQPSRHGHPRHPVVLPRPAFHSLVETSEPHLKSFLQNSANAVNWCEMEDPGLEIDIDRPADYAKAVQCSFGST
jgi:molybdenum cofactor cytidylyltransferase